MRGVRRAVRGRLRRGPRPLGRSAAAGAAGVRMMRQLAEPGASTAPNAPTIGWKIQREMVLLLAWGPAILLQVAHPLVAQGVADHSAFRTQRWGRVRRFHGTLDAMLRLCFGTEHERRGVVARINAIHDTVHGTSPLAAGVFPTGASYSAHDPA